MNENDREINRTETKGCIIKKPDKSENLQWLSQTIPIEMINKKTNKKAKSGKEWKSEIKKRETLKFGL